MNIGNSKSILFTLCLALGGAGLSLQCQAGEQGGGVHKPSKPTAWQRSQAWHARLDSMPGCVMQ